MRIYVQFLLLAVISCNPSTRQTDVAGLILQGSEAFQIGDYTGALNLADRALTVNQNSSDAHFIRGRVYFELEQWDHAETAYLAVIDLEPDYPGVRHNLGNIYFGQKQYRSALAQFTQAIRDRTSVRSWHALGAVYGALSLPDSATSAFKKAIALDSLYGPAYTSLADQLEQQGNYSESLNQTKMALMIRPDHVPDRLRQIRILLRLGYINEAATLLQPLIAEHPYHAEPRYLLGQVLQQSGASDQASKRFQEAESLRVMEQERGQLANAAETQPNNFQAQVDYAVALRQTGHLEEALKRYLIAQALRPTNLNLQFHIATLQVDLGNLKHAEKRLLQLLQSDSSYVLAWISLSNIFENTGRTVMAQEAWQEALRLDPDHSAVRQFQSHLPPQ